MTLFEGLAALERELTDAKGFPVGTVRKWKGGDYLKTKDGWVKQAGGKQPSPAPAPAQTPMVAPAGMPTTSRKTNKFGFVEAAKTLLSFLANPDAPENQKAVRELFNTLCSDFGMLDRDKGKAGANKLEQKTKAELPPGVGGVHDWNGTIIVRDKSVARAAKLMEAKKSGAPIPPKAEKGAHVIVHEAVHGHSPIRREQFKGRYRLLEEATTELAARKVMRDTFGTDRAKFSPGPDSYGAYHKFCDSLQQGVVASLGRRGFKMDKPEDWDDFLGEASIEMRRRPPPTDPDKNAYLRRFASSLPIPAERLKQMGGADAVREEVAKAVWMSLKPAREEEKLRTAEAKLVQLGLLDPKSPPKIDPIVLKEIQPYVAALAKAKKDWSDYLAGGPVTESAAAALLDALREARLGLSEAATDEDAGMLPRNDIELAIAYARVLARDGQLDGWALRDLAMLQDDVKGALVKLRDAVEKYGLTVQGADE